MIKESLDAYGLLGARGALEQKALLFSLQETRNSLSRGEQAIRGWKVKASTLNQPEELAHGSMNGSTVYMIT